MFYAIQVHTGFDGSCLIVTVFICFSWHLQTRYNKHIAFWSGRKIFTLSPYNHGAGGKSIKSICRGVLKGVNKKKKKSQRPHPERAECYNTAEHFSSPHPSIFNPRPLIDPPECRPPHHTAIHLNTPPTSPSHVIVGCIYLNMCWNEVFRERSSERSGTLFFYSE